jgi:hypothetical protein
MNSGMSASGEPIYGITSAHAPPCTSSNKPCGIVIPAVTPLFSSRRYILYSFLSALPRSLPNASLKATSNDTHADASVTISIPRRTFPVWPSPISDLRTIVRHSSSRYCRTVSREGRGTGACPFGPERTKVEGEGESYTSYWRYTKITLRRLANSRVL